MGQGAPLPAVVVPRIPKRAPRGETWEPPRWLAVSLWSFFLAIWATLSVVLIVSPSAVDELWAWIGSQSTVFELATWVAFLPVMIAVAVLQTTWDLWVRLGALALCVTWTTVGFYPNRIARRTK